VLGGVRLCVDVPHGLHPHERGLRAGMPPDAPGSGARLSAAAGEPGRRGLRPAAAPQQFLKALLSEAMTQAWCSTRSRPTGSSGWWPAPWCWTRAERRVSDLIFALRGIRPRPADRAAPAEQRRDDRRNVVLGAAEPAASELFAALARGRARRWADANPQWVNRI
jgi:hypothetical protein